MTGPPVSIFLRVLTGFLYILPMLNILMRFGDPIAIGVVALNNYR